MIVNHKDTLKRWGKKNRIKKWLYLKTTRMDRDGKITEELLEKGMRLKGREEAKK